MSLRAQRSLGVASIVVAALAYRQLLFWKPDSMPLPPLSAWLVLPTGTSPQLILALVAALLYRKRKQLREAVQAHGSPALAILPLLSGFSLFLWGHYVEAGDLILASLVLVSLGASLLWFGTRFARVLSLPLVVLLFAIPPPAVLTNQAFFFLQLWIARHATALLSLIGSSAFREGNVIYRAGGATMVIDSCSGLRFMEILTLIAIVYVAWFPARRARGALLVVLAPVIAYAFNLVRVCLLILNPTSPLSELHTLQGLLVFPGAALSLVLVDRALSHPLPTLQRRDELGPKTQPLGMTSSNRGPWAVALGALLVVMLGVSVWMPRWSSPETGRPAAKTYLPSELNGWSWQGPHLRVDHLYLATLGFSSYAYRLFQRNDEQVSVFFGRDGRTLRRRSLISPKNAFPSRGWEVHERGFATLDPCGTRVERILAQSDGRRMLSYHWYEGTEGLVLETLRALLATDRSPLARPEPARVIRVAAEFGLSPGAPAQAEVQLHHIACSLRDAHLAPGAAN